MNNTPAEPLTVAYAALGAVHALQRAPTPNAFTRMADAGAGGQLNFVDECITHAGVADRLFRDEFADTFGGVFAYDIAECFGERVAQRILAGECVNAQEAEQIARELFALHALPASTPA